MTEQIIRSKKFKLARVAGRFGLGLLRVGAGSLLTATLFPSAARAVSGNLPKLPVLQQVGVVPVQWEGDEVPFGLEKAKTNLDQAFSQAVRRARRFRVLSDDLVSGLWKT